MKEFKIAGRPVGGAAPAYVIAEAGDNHLGSLATAMEMARLSKLAGADAVKFQHHLPDEEMLPDVPMSDNMKEPLYEFLQKNSLKISDHVELQKYCVDIGLQYLCTPFSYRAAVELRDASILDAIKIGSGEMTDLPSLIKMASFGVPMIVSTGMCSIEEIRATYEELNNRGVDLALMNCVSEYPPVYEDINLGVIKLLINEFPRAVIGQSDHTPTNYTCFGAIAMGAKIIEKHVIIDKLTPGPDQSVSLDFDEFHDLVRGIRILEAASGDIKKVHPKEKIIREWAFRSVVSTRHISAGEVITQEDIWSKRPGTGIPSKEMGRIVGKIATADIPKNTLLRWDQIK